jgi:hypothetical protein
MSPERLQAMAILAEKFGAAWEKLDDATKLQLADQLLASGEAIIYTKEQLDKMSEASGIAEKAMKNVQVVATSAALAFLDYAKAIGSAVSSGFDFVKSTGAFQSVADAVKSVGSEVKGVWENFIPEKVRGFFGKVAEFTPLARIIKATTGERKPGAPSALEQIGAQIGGMPQASTGGSAATRLSTVAPIARQSDSLQRIGLFVGGAGNPAIAIGREQLQVLRQILVLQRQTLQETKRL